MSYCNNRLRGTILKLQDRLSNDDRKRLHFFLGNEVPRLIRDDSTLNGTLTLMESLFDQDKISEEDFAFLINAFDEIQCTDAVKILKEHKERMQLSPMYRSTHSLAVIMPPLIDEIFTDLDKHASPFIAPFINEEKRSCGIKEIINTDKTKFNPVNLFLDNNEKFSSTFEKNQPSYISFRINKYLFVMVLSLLIGSLTLMTVLITQINENKNKDNIILREQQKKNEMIQRLNNLEAENNKTKELVDELISPKKGKNNPLILAGHRFGGTGGHYFDDSLHPDFTCSHYLNGLVTHDNDDGLESYQFLYLPSDDNGRSIESDTHGNQTSRLVDKFPFGKNVKINRVNFTIIHKKWISPNGTNLTREIITGIKFYSDDVGLSNPLFHNQSGEERGEEFPGYTLGYVTGRSGQYIEQLQFFWYRTKDTKPNE